MYEKAKETIINDESYEKEFYLCSMQKLSVGIGHNVTDNGIHPAVMAQLLRDGCIKNDDFYKYEQIGGKLGAHSLFNITHFSDAAVKLQFRIDFDNCLKDARNLFPYFDMLGGARRTVILNMCFQLGYNRFSKFKKFIKAARDHDNAGMIREMKDSLYYRQVTKRANRLIKLL